VSPRLNADGEVRAAGGVVVDRSSGVARILFVHRPHYDDWSLPKGKNRKEEDDEVAAIREVKEETGLSCRLGPELGAMHYRDRFGRRKVARYWLMTTEPGAFEPNKEVDRTEWVDLADAPHRPTRGGEREFLARIVPVLAAEGEDGAGALAGHEPVHVWEKEDSDDGDGGGGGGDSGGGGDDGSGEGDGGPAGGALT